MREQIEMVFSGFESIEAELIPVLQAVQGELGYLPEEAMLEIARFLSVPESRVFGVASFYEQFRFTPIGRNHIMVCRGTACHVKGAPRILEEVERLTGVPEGQTSKDLEYSVETVACVGCCGLAPTMVVNKETHGRVSVKKIKKILKAIRKTTVEGQDE